MAPDKISTDVHRYQTSEKNQQALGQYPETLTPIGQAWPGPGSPTPHYHCTSLTGPTTRFHLPGLAQATYFYRPKPPLLLAEPGPASPSHNRLL